jgi:hypothetical protein
LQPAVKKEKKAKKDETEDEEEDVVEEEEEEEAEEESPKKKVRASYGCPWVRCMLRSGTHFVCVSCCVRSQSKK